ncbi:hypothetical protein ACJ41O_000553 [Fusarium nematophilum]
MSDNANGDSGPSNNERQGPRRSSRLNQGVPSPFLQQNYVLNENKPTQTPAPDPGSSSDEIQDSIIVGPLPAAGRAEAAIAAIRSMPPPGQPVRRPPQTPGEAETSGQAQGSRTQTGRRGRASTRGRPPTRASTRGRGRPIGRPPLRPRAGRQVQPARQVSQTQQLDSQAQGGNSRPSRPMSARAFIISRMAEELRSDPDKGMRDDLAEHRSKVEAILKGDGIVESFMQGDDGLGPDTSQFFDEAILEGDEIVEGFMQGDDSLGPDTSQHFDEPADLHRLFHPDLVTQGDNNGLGPAIPQYSADNNGLRPATPQYFGDFISGWNNNGLGQGTAQNLDEFDELPPIPIDPNLVNSNAGDGNNGLFRPLEDGEGRGTE